jgi:prepilin-type N-terminal cleavage/methylation domain-containing protein
VSGTTHAHGSTCAQRACSEEGFSLIELLVVILVLGLLLGIGVTSFSGQTNRSGDGKSKSVAKTVATALEECYLQTRSYPTCGATAGAKMKKLDLLQADVTLGGGTDQAALTFPSGVADNYSVKVLAPSGATWAIDRTSGGTPVRTCTAPSYPRGDCRSAGQSW